MKIETIAVFRTPTKDLLDEFKDFTIRFIVDDVRQGTFLEGIPVISMSDFVQNRQSSVDALFIGKMWDAANSGGYFERLEDIRCPLLSTDCFLRHIDRQYRAHWDFYFNRFVHYIRGDLSFVSGWFDKYGIDWSALYARLCQEYDEIEPQTEKILKTAFSHSWDTNSVAVVDNFIELIRLTHHRKSTLKTSDEYFYREIRPAPGDIVLNAGGDAGHEIPGFISRIGDTGRHFIFDPSSSSAEFLRERFQHSPGTIIIEKGLYKETADLPLWCKPDNPGVSVAAETPPNDSFKKAYEIPVTTIDTFVRDNCLDRVDFIKMDIEGGEYDALLGGQETISKFQPKLAICVYHTRRPTSTSVSIEDEDILRIPRLIRDICPEYTFYLAGTEMTSWGGTKLFGHISAE